MDLQGKRILIVEDEPMIATFVEELVVEAGCEVVGMAARLDRALEMASTLDFDAAILDVRLHQLSTESVAAVLRQRELPFIVSSGYGAPPEGFGGAVSVAKPYASITLIDGLRRILTQG